MDLLTWSVRVNVKVISTNTSEEESNSVLGLSLIESFAWPLIYSTWSSSPNIACNPVENHHERDNMHTSKDSSSSL